MMTPIKQDRRRDGVIMQVSAMKTFRENSIQLWLFAVVNSRRTWIIMQTMFQCACQVEMAAVTHRIQ